tara:strand:- start:4122 stop:4550 length:429 start_codon:yes stop_codon:yes gene_type:complete
MENKNVYEELDKIVQKLQSTNDAKRKYEYILWLGKKLPSPNNEIIIPENKVKGCVSEVYVKGTLKEGKIQWEGYSDALITRGLLSFLIKGLDNLSPDEILNLNNNFIDNTGLKKSLTPSRSNGFLNILIKMKSQANNFLIAQ